MAVPVGLAFWFIHNFGVNVPFADSWNGTLPSVKALVSGHLSFALLWLPHNENRMLFPNLIQALVDSHTRVNSLDDMYLSAAVMTITVVLLIWLAVRTTGISLVWMVPVPFLFFSLVQVGNLLWAFQLAWMLILLCTIVCLWGLEASRGRALPFVLACLVGVVASYSSLQGLLVWPVGLTYALGRGLSRAQLALWCLLAVVTTAFYEWHIGNIYTVGSPTFALARPVLALRYFLQLMGGIVPAHHTTLALLMLGASALAGWGLTRHQLARARLRLWAESVDEEKVGGLYGRQVPLARLRLPLALWLSGILFDAMVTIGRLQLNAPESSRYTTYNLVFLIGLYLGVATLLSPPARWRELAALRDRPWRAALTAVVLAAVLVQIGWAIPNGIHRGHQLQVSRSQAALLLREYRAEPNAALATALFPPSGGYVKVWAHWLQAKRWSVFS
ncbi:MAG: hypothetical protein ACYCYK_02355 [Candidatus Dormibacteria bacterium]